MALAGFLTAQAASQYLAAVAMLGLAGWLLVLDSRGRTNRAFALFLALRGASLAAGTVTGIAPARADPDLASLVEAARHVSVVTGLASLGALLHFLAVYPRPVGRVGTSRWGSWALLAGTLFVLAVYAFRPCAFFCFTDGAPRLVRWGPLAVVTMSIATGVAGIVFLGDARRAPDGPQREGLQLVGGVFALNSLFDGVRGTLVLLAAATSGDFGAAISSGAVPNLWLRLVFFSPVVALALAAAGIALVSTRRSEAPRRLLAFAGAAVLSGVFVGLLAGAAPAGFSLFVLGLWRLAVPAVVTYAILRHQLFGLEAKVRLGVSRGTMAATFVFVFVVGTQAAQEYLNTQYGYVVGGLAAALLFFALEPLQRFSKAVAGAAIPPSHRGDATESAYRAALEMALADGTLTRAEERQLATIAAKLGIDAERAFALREEVEDELGAVAA